MISRYVDPDWGGPFNGTSSQPWASLTAGAWATLNGDLATDTVTVYFSARQAGSDTDQPSTTALALNRTDTGTNRITLDGLSQYNTNDTTPSWSTYTGSSRFKITATYPCTTNNQPGPGGPWPDRNYITVRGFKFVASDGQIVALMGVHNFIFELNDCSHTGTPGTGPGVISGIPFATSSGGTGGTWPTHLTIQNNTIHNTFGEGIYIGGSTPDPPGLGTQQTGDDILVKGNTITDSGLAGGQGDGIDIKDGNTNLRIVNNVLTWPSGSSGLDNQGIVAESGDLIDGNYIEKPEHNGIAIFAGWNNTLGRSALILRNNIIVNITGAVGHHNGIELANATSTTYQWSNTKVYNNSIYNVLDAGVQGDTPHASITVENNIIHTAGGNGIAMDAAGMLTTHDYNDFFAITGNALALSSGNTTCANIATVETHSKCADPAFVSSTAPYTAANFRLKSSSPAIGAGLVLSSVFTDDYAANTRTSPWDMGAYATVTGGGRLTYIGLTR